MLRILPRFFAAVLSWVCLTQHGRAESRQTDVFVYGATPGGVAAAVTAARSGCKVILADPGYFPGGMMAGGLTKTDLGNRLTVGGMPMEFFAHVFKSYQDTYGADSLQARQTEQGAFFEPKVAAQVFQRMLDDAGVQTLLKHRLSGASSGQGAIISLTLQSTDGQETTSVAAREFIDGSYEGDLLAAVGVPYRIGREGRDEYHESFAGMTKGPGSFLGKGDHRLQSYNVRSTLTNRPDLALPIPKPQNYHPEAFLDVEQAVLDLHLETFEQLYPDAKYWGEVNGKFDPNKADAIGMDYNYVEADPEGRTRIVRDVRDHWLSLWYMLQNDPALPPTFRESARKWGLPKDEFMESDHVSPLVYVREGRRMLGRHLLIQNDVQDERFKEDAICLGSYGIDSHVVQRILMADGRRVDEGELGYRTDPYEIPYRSITPFAPNNLLVVCAISATHVAYSTMRMEPVFMMIGQAAGTAATLALKNQLPVQDIPVSALQAELHAAGVPLQAPFRPKIEIAALTPPPYRSGEEVRFTANVVRSNVPVDDIVWNFDGSGAVQARGRDVSYRFNVAKPFTVTANAKDANGVEALQVTEDIVVGQHGTLDAEVAFDEAKVQGQWRREGSDLISYRARSLYSDWNDGKGTKLVTFEARVPEDGFYQVAIAYAEGPDRAKNVPVTIEHADGSSHVDIDQTSRKPFAFVPLGLFRFSKEIPARVIVGNAGTGGFVIVDAVKWLREVKNPKAL